MTLVYYLLGFNAVIVVMALSFYLLIGRRQKIKVDFEEYLASLPRDTIIRDPYVLVDGKWVKSNQWPSNSSSNP